MRNNTIDLLRGIAILGILYINIYHLGSITIGYSPLPIEPLSDKIIEVLNSLFIDGRFRSLFCLLFGAGLMIQHKNANRAQRNSLAMIKPRLYWLLLFGFIHGVFIFAGDILLSYAIAGLLVCHHLDKSSLQLYQKAKTYLALSLTVLFIACLFPEPVITRYSAEYYTLFDNWYGEPINQVIEQGSFVVFMLLASPLCFMWYAGGIMLLGMSLYKGNFFNQGLTTKQLITCIVIALILSLTDIYLNLSNHSAAAELGFAIASVSGLFTALVFSHCIIKLAKNSPRFLTPIQRVGKVALSLYLLQSIIMGWLLRIYMPEFNLDATRLDYLYLVLGYTLLQIAIANLYLKFFNQGPFEYLWRKLYSQHYQQ